MELGSTPSSTNWEEWTAIGTLILAAVTLLAIGVTLWVAKSERSRADLNLAAERKRADDQLADDRRLARHNAERNRKIDLLIALSRSIAVLHGWEGDSARRATATHEAQMYLRALPGDLAVFARMALNVKDGPDNTFSATAQAKYDQRIAQLRTGSAVQQLDVAVTLSQGPPDVNQQQGDIGQDIAELAAQ